MCRQLLTTFRCTNCARHLRTENKVDFCDDGAAKGRKCRNIKLHSAIKKDDLCKNCTNGAAKRGEAQMEPTIDMSEAVEVEKVEAATTTIIKKGKGKDKGALVGGERMVIDCDEAEWDMCE